jgi:hypothetical protein
MQVHHKANVQGMAQKGVSKQDSVALVGCLLGLGNLMLLAEHAISSQHLQGQSQ